MPQPASLLAFKSSSTTQQLCALGSVTWHLCTLHCTSLYIHHLKKVTNPNHSDFIVITRVTEISACMCFEQCLAHRTHDVFVKIFQLSLINKHEPPGTKSKRCCCLVLAYTGGFLWPCNLECRGCDFNIRWSNLVLQDCERTGQEGDLHPVTLCISFDLAINKNKFTNKSEN